MDLNTKSYKDNQKAMPLNKGMMEWYVKNYMRSTEDLKDKRINLVETDFKGIGPVTIITASIDPLQSEGEKLANKMKKQGVDVNYKNFDGVTHEFFGMGQVLKEAQEAQQWAASELKESFGI